MTLVGNLVDDPELRFTPAGQPVAKFRVASTPAVPATSATGEWKDGDSLFLTCNVWRQAAENVAESLTRGMRVIVTGRLRQRSTRPRKARSAPLRARGRRGRPVPAERLGEGHQGRPQQAADDGAQPGRRGPVGQRAGTGYSDEAPF